MSASVAEPNANILTLLADRNRWKIRRGIRSFAEHDEWDAKGKLTKRFDKAALERLARHTNERLQRGDPCPITIGHTHEDEDGPGEETQPRVIGYAKDFRVVYVPMSKKHEIVADYFFYPSTYAEAMTYPRRSVERWVSDDILDPISLIRRTPVCDLGILTDDSATGSLTPSSPESDSVPVYAQKFVHSPGTSQTPKSPIAYRKTGRVIYYMRGLSMPDPELEPTPAPPAAVPPPPGDPAAAAAAPPPEESAEPNPDELPPEHAAMAERYSRHFIRNHPLGRHLAKKYGRECGMEDPAEGDEPAQEPSEQPVQYDAAAAAAAPPAAPGAPGGANAFVPGGPEKEPQRMARESLQIRYSRLEAENVELRKTSSDLVQKFARAEAERQVIQLEGEGFDLDREDEVAEFLKRGTKEEQAKYADKIRIQYRRMRMPINQPFSPTDRDSTRGRKKNYSREQIDAVVKALPEGATQEQYEAALAKLDAA